MVLAYVDKLANDDNGVKFLLVLQDLFDRTVDAKRMKTKRLQGNFQFKAQSWTHHNFGTVQELSDI